MLISHGAELRAPCDPHKTRANTAGAALDYCVRWQPGAIAQVSSSSELQLGGVPPQPSKSSHVQPRPAQADEVVSSLHVVMPEQR